MHSGQVVTWGNDNPCALCVSVVKIQINPPRIVRRFIRATLLCKMGLWASLCAPRLCGENANKSGKQRRAFVGGYLGAGRQLGVGDAVASILFGLIEIAVGQVDELLCSDLHAGPV